MAAAIITKALELGFADAACVPAAPDASQACFEGWLASGRAAGMQFLAQHAPLRRHPETLLPGARTIVMVAARYRPGKPGGHFAGHALLPDYHDVMRTRLRRLAEFIRADIAKNARHRICVDSAPLPERAWALRAGLGRRGRQGALLHPRFGCCLFLGALILDTPMPDMPSDHATPATNDVDHAPLASAHDQCFSEDCRACRLCVAACPNHAIGADGLIDARRCAAYWTIEHKDLIPAEAGALVGHNLFGCDRCTAACPRNPADAHGIMPEFITSAISPPDPAECLAMTEAQFAGRFKGTPVIRLGRARLQRNAVIVLRNQGQPPRAGNNPNLTALAARQLECLRGPGRANM